MRDFEESAAVGGLAAPSARRGPDAIGRPASCSRARPCARARPHAARAAAAAPPSRQAASTPASTPATMWSAAAKALGTARKMLVIFVYCLSGALAATGLFALIKLAL